MGSWGMTGVDTIARIRFEHYQNGKGIKRIAWELGVARDTVRKVLRSGATEFSYKREVQPLPKLGAWIEVLSGILQAEAALPKRERRSTQRLFEEERAALTPFRAQIAGFVEKPMRATSTCLIAHDRNKYSVDARAAGRGVLVRAYADRLSWRCWARRWSPTTPAASGATRRSTTPGTTCRSCRGSLGRSGTALLLSVVEGQGLVAAAGLGPGARPAAASRRRRPPVRPGLGLRAGPWHRRGRGGLRRSPGGRHRQRRRSPDDPGPTPAPPAGTQHHRACRAQAQGRICGLRRA